MIATTISFDHSRYRLAGSENVPERQARLTGAVSAGGGFVSFRTASGSEVSMLVTDRTMVHIETTAEATVESAYVLPGDPLDASFDFEFDV